MNRHILVIILTLTALASKAEQEQTPCELLFKQMVSEDPTLIKFLTTPNQHGSTPLQEAESHSSMHQYAHGAQSAQQYKMLETYFRLNTVDRREMNQLVMRELTDGYEKFQSYKKLDQSVLFLRKLACRVGTAMYEQRAQATAIFKAHRQDIETHFKDHYAINVATALNNDFANLNT